MRKKCCVLHTWNVNGIRAVWKKDFPSYLAESAPQVLALQETKIQEDQLLEEMHSPHSYGTHWSSCTIKKGYSGVAIFTHKNFSAPLSVNVGLGVKKFDQEGRTLWIEYPEFHFFSCYIPNGQRDHGRVDFKLEYSRKLLKFAGELHKKTKKGVILSGDFNTAHQEIDLKNPKANEKTTGFLPRERKFLDKMIGEGFIDIYREQHPEEEGAYTWWTYRQNCRARNIGWRLDYFFVTEDLRERVVKTSIRSDVMGSDHCPVELVLDVS